VFLRLCDWSDLDDGAAVRLERAWILNLDLVAYDESSGLVDVRSCFPGSLAVPHFVQVG
jgi:hypothetical protein